MIGLGKADNSGEMKYVVGCSSLAVKKLEKFEDYEEEIK